MTCIVGIEVNNQVLIAGDLQGTGRNNKINHTQPKVFNKGGVVFGFAGSYRFGQLLEYVVQDPVVPNDEEEIYRWLVTVLVPDIKQVLKDHGADGNAHCLIGVKNQLWELQQDYSVLRSINGYASIGSGVEYANGSMFTSVKNNIRTVSDAEQALISAIEAAGTFSPSVGLTCEIVRTK